MDGLPWGRSLVREAQVQGALPGVAAPELLNYRRLHDPGAPRNGEAGRENWKLEEGKSRGVEALFPEVTLRPRSSASFPPTARDLD